MEKIIKARREADRAKVRQRQLRLAERIQDASAACLARETYTAVLLGDESS